ncbi:MAG: T9SS type A sorting domain-containing protein, partial [Candidatus Cloacimonetes bacterium]|nr:T9SS type A sorting domain-containing protein [Candidatus Cloacimonadota bacterium]
HADTLATLINTQSWGIVNWSAHGSSHYSARKVWMYDANNDNIPNGNEMQWFFMVGLDTFDNLVNQDGSVYFCASCYNGMIDDDDASLGEVLIKNKAVADIAATRTGWYKLGWENPGWGGLSSYNYHFLEHYARQGMTVGQAHGFANWLHTQYCLFGDPIDSDGIIWPELQNIYTYLLYGDPAIGYPGNTSSPVAQILIWEPLDNNGNTIVNGLYELGDFNVVYTNHLIDTYNYLNSFDAVFCLFGLGYGQNVYSLPYQGYEYNYLLSYLQQGGKVYMEGMLNWNPDDPLYDRFGTIAPFDHVAYIEQLRYTHNNVNQIWDYNGYNEGTPALATVGVTAQPLFYSYNQYHVNDIIGIWNRIGDSRTISSSFELACVYSDTLSYPQFLRTILDTLGVINNNPVASQDYTNPPAIWNVSASPNPFGRHLNISVKSDKPVTISIYNIKGQLIYSVKELPKNGSIQYLWNGMDESNKYAASGIYLVKVDNGSRSKLIKTLKIR